MKDENLYTSCEATQEDFIKLWEKLVNIDTGSKYGKGINQMGKIIAAVLKELDAKVETIPMADPDHGSHITSVFEGKGQKKLLAMAHMDTVFPEGTASQRPFSIKDGWAYGPGVADCKGSIVLALFTMKVLCQMHFNQFGKITLLFNCDEEIGSSDSRPLIEKLAKEHDYTLCLEPGRRGDGIIIWRKGVSDMKLEVFGKAAHAGNNPKDGVNAISELIHQIQQMSALENPEKKTTVTFTTIQGGDRHNVIPDYALAYADVRSLYPEEFDRIEKSGQEFAQKTVVPGAKVKATLERGNPPFSQNKGSAALISLTQDIYKELGKSLKLEGAGGASDANWAAAAGATAVDSLGPVEGGPCHTEEESSDVSSVVPRMYLLAQLIIRLSQNDSQPNVIP